MENKFLEFISKHWNHFLFSILLLSIFNFLLIPKGTWLYVDLGWWPKNFAENLTLIKQFIFSWDNFSSTYFGFDSYSVSFQKVIISPILFLVSISFGTHVSQFAFYSTALIIGYIFAQRFLSLLNFKNHKIAALFFCFNPVSIFLIAQGANFLAYCIIPVFSYSLLRLLQELRAINILQNLLSLAVLTAYLRILGLVLLLVVTFSIAYLDQIWIAIRRLGYKKIFFTAFIYAFVFSGFLSSFFFIHQDNINSQVDYIAHQTNLYSHEFYKAFQLPDALYLMSLNQISPSFGQGFIYYNELATIILLVVILYFVLLGKDLKRFDFTVVSILLLFYLILMSAKILPIDSFIFLFTKIFPFLTLNILWIRIPMVLCIAVLIATRKEKILNFCVLCFVVLSVSPLFLWPIDYKLQKIDAAPDFFQNKISVLPTLFYPFEVNHASKIALNALPYPIDPSSNSRYHHLFSNNSRLASSEQLDLYKLSLGRPESSWIFGLKDVFVFKDIADFKTGQFDWYEEHDYKQISEYYMDRFSREQLSVLEENPVYAHFKLQNSDNHDFLIYSPKMIIVATSTESYPNLDVDSIPLLFLSEQLSSLDDISFSDLASSLSQDIRLQVKYSYIDPTRYYLKVSAANKRLPLTIHLNQTFNPRWKIYVVNKTVWDSKLCKTEMSDFPITQNATCEYQYSVKDYFSISLLDRNIRGIDSRHLSGNIIGNTFLIKPNTLDEYSDSDGAIYLMIYFQKQDYYVIMLSLFVSIITALSCFVAFRRIKSLGAHKEHIYLHVI